MDLVDCLRGRAETTVGALALELEVSSRTVLRDLAALRERGLPIVGDAGPGGGIRLDGARGVTAVHMSVTEVVAIWLAARLSREGSDLPWSQAANSGLSKLLASLPSHKATALRELCRRVIVGPPVGAEIRSSAGSPPRELLRLFEEGFTSGIGLGFRYTDRFGNESVRRIEPHGLLVETPVWYILARDVDKQEPRTFRMDRIIQPSLQPQIRFRPDLQVIQAQVPEPEKRRPLTD